MHFAIALLSTLLLTITPLCTEPLIAVHRLSSRTPSSLCKHALHGHMHSSPFATLGTRGGRGSILSGHTASIKCLVPFHPKKAYVCCGAVPQLVRLNDGIAGQQRQLGSVLRDTPEPARDAAIVMVSCSIIDHPYAHCGLSSTNRGGSLFVKL